MARSDICNTELNGVSGIRIPNAEFQRIVRNGFNPFARDISFGTGFTLADVGFGSIVFYQPLSSTKIGKRKPLPVTSIGCSVTRAPG